MKEHLEKLRRFHQSLSEEGRWLDPSRAARDLEEVEVLSHKLSPEAKPLLEAALRGDREAEATLDEHHPLHAHLLVARRLLEAALRERGEENPLVLCVAQLSLLVGLEEALGVYGSQAPVHRA